MSIQGRYVAKACRGMDGNSDMCNLHLSVFVLVTEMFFKSFNYFKPSCRKLSGPRGM